MGVTTPIPSRKPWCRPSETRTRPAPRTSSPTRRRWESSRHSTWEPSPRFPGIRPGTPGPAHPGQAKNECRQDRQSKANRAHGQSPSKTRVDPRGKLSIVRRVHLIIVTITKPSWRTKKRRNRSTFSRRLNRTGKKDRLAHVRRLRRARRQAGRICIAMADLG